MIQKLLIDRYIDFVLPTLAPNQATIQPTDNGFVRVNPVIFHLAQSASESSEVVNTTGITVAGTVSGASTSKNRTQFIKNYVTRHVLERNQTSQIVYTQHAKKDYRNFIWLPYIKGSVSEVVQNGSDVFTGPLSGCWVTSYYRNGARYIAHVGTVDDPAHAQSVSSKNAWNQFATAELNSGTPPGDILGIRTSQYQGTFPTADIKKGDSGAVFYALVTSDNRFFIVVLYQHIRNRNRYRIALVDEMHNMFPPDRKIP